MLGFVDNLSTNYNEVLFPFHHLVGRLLYEDCKGNEF